MKRLIALAIFALLLGGCATTNFMPSSDERSVDSAGVNSYADAEKLVSKVEEGKTTVDDLARFGLDLRAPTNVSIMKPSDLSALFSPNIMLANVLGNPEYVHAAAKLCLKPGVNCTPYIYRKDGAKEVGKGSFVLRMLNFKKESTIYGWSVEILFVVHNNVIVFKQMGGVRETQRDKTERHPLGPADGIGLGGLIRR